MDNGTAGRGASPPPQPAEASPSERWSQAWAENFPGAAAPGNGASPPVVAPDRSPVAIYPPRPEVPAGPPPSTVPGSGPRAAASHRQQRDRKLRRPGPPTPQPDDTEPGSRRSRGRTTALLCAVLAVQAALSLRLVRADTALEDEATSLWAGHLEWAHWLHGTSVPPFPAYFSGAPVIYPPLGALADSLGGLAGARVLSLLFMLGATALLWVPPGPAVRAAGRVFRAALFAVLGPTLHLGAFATYDALRWC